MNPFQRQCSQAIDDVLAGCDLTVHFTEQATVPPAEDGAAMFLRADLVHGDRHYKLFVYPDGAGASVARNWYVLESQNYPSPEVLIETFCRFLQSCLEGLHPLKALEQARR